MRQAPADGATVAYGQMCHVLHRSRHYGQVRFDDGRGLERVVAREGADPDDVAGRIDIAKIANAIDIDEDRRSDQPEVEHRHQALSAGKNFPIAACSSQHRDGFIEGLRSHVVKCGGLHVSGVLTMVPSDVPAGSAAHLATLTYLPSTTLRIALEPAPSRFSSMVISPATPGKFLRPARQPRILSRSASRSLGLLVTPDASMQCL